MPSSSCWSLFRSDTKHLNGAEFSPQPWGAGGQMIDSQTYDMLLKRYGSTCLPLELVRQHYLSHMGMPALLREFGKGRISLRVVKGEWGGRMQRVVYLHDLASWLDQGGN
ncbi:pyocin activator PrtN family protein [Pseudomonas sp. FYR_5]|uniref:pyocin activator PrtN family protein n=2 Tax=unclassified Pseudomonas TaxID=196821 RepID=UPI00370B416F